MTVTTAPRRSVAALSTTTISRLPTGVDMILYQGDDFALTITVRNPDGTDADLTGAIVRSQIRVNPGDATVAGQFTVGVTGNMITLTLPGPTSATLPNQCVWDCEMTVSGRTTTLVAGRITLTPEVTR